MLNSDKDTNKLTDEDLRYAVGVMVVGLQRIYDALVYQIMLGYGEETVKRMLDAHGRHEYLWPTGVRNVDSE